MEDPRGAVRVQALCGLLCQRGSKHGSKRLSIVDCVEMNDEGWVKVV